MAAALAAGLCACAHPAAGVGALAPLRIGVIGDQTGTDDLDAAYAVMARGVEALNAEGVSLVLHTGDLIESAAPEETVRADYARATAILNRLQAPWRMALGDHDANPPVRQQASADRAREALFMSLYSAHAPEAQAPYYAFDQQGVRFIALYAHDTLHADPRWGVTFLAEIEDAQFAWLRATLEDPARPADVIVFLHQPLWYNWSGWSRVHALLAAHRVRAVIAGHTHYPQSDAPLDGVAYIVVGSTGGDTKDGAPNAGDLRHVSVIELSAAGLDWRLIPLDAGLAEAAPAPRAAMDRVQAVSSMLWSALREAPPAGPGCVSGLVIPRLGNPIDVPLTLSAQVDGRTETGRFDPALCAGTATGCVLAPAAGVSVSNTSSVAFATAAPAAPAWAAPASEGVTHTVTVTATFEWAGAPYRLEHAYTLAPQVCPNP